MKKVVLLTIFAALMMISSAAVAQTANGTLTVTATVNGSIQLVFNSDAAGVAFRRGHQHCHAGIRQRVGFWRSLCRRCPHHHRDHLHREFCG